MRATLALPNWLFVPAQPEPVQIFDDRLFKFRPAAIAIKIFETEKKDAVAGARTFLCVPKSERVAGVQVASGRRGEPTAIGNCRLQNSGFRLNCRSAI